MTTEPVDFLDACRHSALGEWPVHVVDAASHAPPGPDVQALVIGLDHAGDAPGIDAAAFDVLLTERAGASRPWVTVPSGRLMHAAERLVRAVRVNPVAATILGRVLRIAETLPFAQALEVESFAYSTLLAGGEFARWREGRGDPAPKSAQQASRQATKSTPFVSSAVETRSSDPASLDFARDERPGHVERDRGPPLLIERMGDTVTLTLNHPASRNAMTAAMRDALHEALANCLDDPRAPEVILRGAGRCFSTGGDLAEFGTARDLAQAHVIRTVRSCAALLDRLGTRARVHVHGACIGSGLEIAAAASHRVAAPNGWFQLPEVQMGLIPGAGGTASLSRAIGRHRTAWLALTGKRIDAQHALDCGLIHEIEA